MVGHNSINGICESSGVGVGMYGGGSVLTGVGIGTVHGDTTGGGGDGDITAGDIGCGIVVCGIHIDTGFGIGIGVGELEFTLTLAGDGIGHIGIMFIGQLLVGGDGIGLIMPVYTILRITAGIITLIGIILKKHICLGEDIISVGMVLLCSLDQVNFGCQMIGGISGRKSAILVKYPTILTNQNWEFTKIIGEKLVLQCSKHIKTSLLMI